MFSQTSYLTTFNIYFYMTPFGRNKEEEPEQGEDPINRINGLTRRIRELEKNVRNLKEQTKNIEQRLNQHKKKISQNKTNSENKNEKLSHRIETLNSEIKKLNRKSRKLVSKREFKEIEEFMDMLDPVKSDFTTEKDVKKIVEEKMREM